MRSRDNNTTTTWLEDLHITPYMGKGLLDLVYGIAFIDPFAK